MASRDPRYGTPQWRRTRLWVIDRDLGLCQIRGHRCSHGATEADHIVAVADGGDFWAVANLRAACAPCNRGRGADITNMRRGWRYSTTEPKLETRM